MDTKDIILIVISIFSFVMAGYVYGRNKESHINRSFALMYIFAAIWILSLVLFRMSSNTDYAFNFAKLMYIAALFIASTFYYFAATFPFPSFIIKLKIIILIYLLAIFVVILLFIPSFILGGIVIQSGGNEVILNDGYYIYVIGFILYIIGGFYLMLKKYFKSEGINKVQFKYVLFGFFVGFFIGMTFDLFLPLFGNYQLVWIGPYSAFIAMVSVLYLILRKT